MRAINDLRSYDQRIDSNAYPGTECGHHADRSHSIACTGTAPTIAKKRTDHAEHNTCNCPVSCTIAERIAAPLLNL